MMLAASLVPWAGPLGMEHFVACGRKPVNGAPVSRWLVACAREGAGAPGRPMALAAHSQQSDWCKIVPVGQKRLPFAPQSEMN